MRDMPRNDSLDVERFGRREDIDEEETMMRKKK